MLAAAEARADGPCNGGSRIEIAAERVPDSPCDGDDITIDRACHCTVDRKEERPWGPTANLSLELPRTLRVASGQWVDVPFALKNRGDKPVVLDFSGGAVISEAEIRQGRRTIHSAPCGVLAMLPPLVRLTLRPGGTIHGTLGWNASNYPHPSGCDLAEDLRPGRYTVTFESASGEPPLQGKVAVTVTRRR